MSPEQGAASWDCCSGGRATDNFKAEQGWLAAAAACIAALLCMGVAVARSSWDGSGGVAGVFLLASFWHCRQVSWHAVLVGLICWAARALSRSHPQLHTIVISLQHASASLASRLRYARRVVPPRRSGASRLANTAITEGPCIRRSPCAPVPQFRSSAPGQGGEHCSSGPSITNPGQCADRDTCTLLPQRCPRPAVSPTGCDAQGNHCMRPWA